MGAHRDNRNRHGSPLANRGNKNRHDSPPADRNRRRSRSPEMRSVPDRPRGQQPPARSFNGHQRPKSRSPSTQRNHRQMSPTSRERNFAEKYESWDRDNNRPVRRGKRQADDTPGVNEWRRQERERIGTFGLSELWGRSPSREEESDVETE